MIFVSYVIKRMLIPSYLTKNFINNIFGNIDFYEDITF